MPDKLPAGMDDEQYQVFLRQQLATTMRKYPVWPMDTSNPKEWYPGQGGEASIFQGPVSTIDPIGAISPSGAQRSLGKLGSGIKDWSFESLFGINKPKSIGRVSHWIKSVVKDKATDVFLPKHIRAARKAIKGIPPKEMANLSTITNVPNRLGVRGVFDRTDNAIELNPSNLINMFKSEARLTKDITKSLGHEFTHNRQFNPQRNIIDNYTSGLMRKLSDAHLWKKGGDYWSDPKEIHARKFSKALMPFYDKKRGTVAIKDKQWDNIYRETMVETLKEVKKDWGSDFDFIQKGFHEIINKSNVKEYWAEDIGFAQGSARDPFGDMWGKYNQMLDDGLPF